MRPASPSLIVKVINLHADTIILYIRKWANVVQFTRPRYWDG